jgi:predicted TIM-barrel fold metal-dependent hydrolase
MTSTLSRRSFLEAAATRGVVATGLASNEILAGASFRAMPAGDAPIPIVDTHQHLWDLNKFRLAWTDSVPKLAKSYLMKDYLEATDGLGVAKTVYMEVDVVPEQQVAEAEYVIDICRRGDTPMRAAVISGRPASDGFKDYITRFKDSKYIKGVRQVLHGAATPRGHCLDKKFIASVRLLGELGMSYDLCMRNGELEDGARLIDACPDTRFILDHCGNGDVQSKDHSAWQRGLAAVAARKNVVCKVSGIIASAKPDAWRPADLEPIIRYTIDQFGPDRVMFGGDWPVCTLAATFRQWVEALREILDGMNLATTDQRKLFHDNAIKFYRLV